MIPWILIGIAFLIILLLIIALKRKSLMNKPTDYKALFILGITFLPLGIVLKMHFLWAMGAIYMAIGLINKDKWNKKHKPTQKEIKAKKFILIGLLIFLIAGVIAFLLVEKNILGEKKEISDFESCIAAGNPAMESYPRQCRHQDRTFIEEINRNK